MKLTGLLLAVLLGFAPLPQTQRRPATAARTTGQVALAVRVSDPADGPIGGVKVTLDGPTHRQATTEGGRIAFENLPAGTYRLRFERDGFVTLEREVVGRGGTPIDVKVTLTPAPEPPAPPPAVAPPPPPPPSDAAPIALDLPAFIEKNYIGRDARKISPLGCAEDTTATLIQLHEPLAEHTHATAEEFLYVIAGQGSVRIEARDQALTAGVFVLVPRGLSHAVTVSGKSPLVLLSIRPGEGCAPPAR
ncbi:MAG: carboxypeptidase regulatory-like domain-containing protein [Acidobacteriota bacterium]